MSTQKYTWAQLITTLVIPSDKLSQTKFKAAIDYCYNFYCDDKNQVFSENEVKFIAKEIKDEAEHKIRLAHQDLEQEQLRQDWPGVDAYVEDLLNRGPYPGNK
jgi:hypothetical protein